MRSGDVFGLALRSLAGHPLRSLLVLAAMAIGSASVVALTALGEGARRFVEGEFSSLGTHLLIVLPGRTETVGSLPPLLGETPRDLTIADAEAIARAPSVRRVAPIVIGTAPVSFGARDREVTVFGTTYDFFAIRHLELAGGQMLPDIETDRALPVCVIGDKIRNELFGSRQALGENVRIGDRRFQVIGIIGSRGRSLGADLDDMVTIPVASAQALFDSPALFRVLVEARSERDIETARAAVIDVIRQRHEGEDDVTVVTQDAVLSTFNRILTTLTISIAGIASVSLIVASILIMNVCLVSVVERTQEIGLIKAIGGTRRGVLALFLTESGLLSFAGGALGLALGHAGVAFLGRLYPSFPVTVPLWATLAAQATAVGAGLLFSTLPASRAARLDPVLALARR